MSARSKWMGGSDGVHDSRVRSERGRISTWGWLSGAILLAVLCAIGPVLVARSAARSDTEKSRRAFAASSAEIASTLQLAIHDEESLVVNASAFVLDNPNASNARFGQWVATVGAFRRYPELSGIGLTVLVPASELAAFAAHQQAHPAGPLGPAGRFTAIPPGARPFFCFLKVAAARSLAATLPAGFDFCPAPSARAYSFGARDSGESSYRPIPAGKQTVLGVQVPIYRGGAVPATVAGRRRAFVGWVGIGLNPSLVLVRAVQGHPHTAVSMRFRGGSSDVAFRVGGVPRHSRSVAIDLHNGWTVTTSSAAVNDGVLADARARALLIGGLVLSVLLGILFFVLGTGRARAWRLVREATQELRHQALHDGLTGLPNRALILDRVEQALARARRQNGSVAVMFLDLDGFKGVNDTSGHEVGDQLLQAIADRLAGLVRDSDTVGRLGGDEFVVVAEGNSLDAGPEVIAERILELIAEPFHLGSDGELTVNSHASVGIALGTRATASELLRDADIALYEAKNAGKGGFVLFAPEMQVVVQQRLDLDADLRNALAADEFFLAYQPTFNLQTNTITGVEALIRWHHPTRGLLMPDEFIAAAEETGLIVPIGRWVLAEACRQAAEWHRGGHTLGISVNISGRQLDCADLLEDVGTALAESTVDPTLLTLEITETVLMRDVGASADRLKALKELGVRIAIDDFGTGYSSMAYLQQFSVDALKIDRSFISGVAQNAESSTLIHTMVQLGKALGLETLAEGIEEPEQLRGLLHEQCDSGQGYLFARPLTPEALQLLISATPHAPVV